MKNTTKSRLVDGINVMSNPLMMLCVIVFMFVTGWLTMNSFYSVLWSIAIGYLILAAIGGYLSKKLELGLTNEEQ